MRLIDVWIHCPDAATARAIADEVIVRRLAASAAVHPEIESRYHWRGEVRQDAEVPLCLRTLAEHFEAVAAIARVLHPNETPSIRAADVRATSDYAAWVAAETAAP